MALTLYAQPYDVSATGFRFGSIDDSEIAAARCRNDVGPPVEEFEIQFIGGDLLDCELVRALNLNQSNLPQFFDLCALPVWEKAILTIALGEYAYDLPAGEINVDAFDIEIYELNSMRELAEQFVDEGLMGEIPDHLLRYLTMMHWPGIWPWTIR